MYFIVECYLTLEEQIACLVSIWHGDMLLYSNDSTFSGHGHMQSSEQLHFSTSSYCSHISTLKLKKKKSSTCQDWPNGGKMTKRGIIYMVFTSNWTIHVGRSIHCTTLIQRLLMSRLVSKNLIPQLLPRVALPSSSFILSPRTNPPAVFSFLSFSSPEATAVFTPGCQPDHRVFPLHHVDAKP